MECRKRNTCVLASPSFKRTFSIVILPRWLISVRSFSMIRFKMDVSWSSSTNSIKAWLVLGSIWCFYSQMAKSVCAPQDGSRRLVVIFPSSFKLVMSLYLRFSMVFRGHQDVCSFKTRNNESEAIAKFDYVRAGSACTGTVCRFSWFLCFFSEIAPFHGSLPNGSRFSEVLLTNQYASVWFLQPLGSS